MPDHLFCFGFGYVAEALSARLAGKDWRLSASVRSPEKASALTQKGISAHLLDRSGSLTEPTETLADVTHLLVSAPPGKDGDPVLAANRDVIATAPELRWIGYLSTTGVYGDRNGGWVDETSALDPSGPRGQRRVDAEAAWSAFARASSGGSGRQVDHFRLAGIYGPGRNALVTMLTGKGRRIVKQGQVFSRTHLDDIVAVLEAAVARTPDPAHPVRAYNICDDEAAPPQDVIAHAAQMLGLPIPPDIPFETAELSDMARSFYADNKRVDNARIKDELGVRLRYPTYREGLADLIETDPAVIKLRKQ